MDYRLIDYGCKYFHTQVEGGGILSFVCNLNAYITMFGYFQIYLHIL